LAHRDITSRFRGEADGRRIGYAKLKIIIMVFKELNLLTITDVEEEVYKFGIHYTTSKTELDKSNILRRLRSQMSRNG
jgi:hypothetical protein